MSNTMIGVPIKTRDGANVKVGKEIYIVETKEVDTYTYRRNKKNFIKSLSGKKRATIEIHKVIHVNEAANSRSFTLRSQKGCETTYSVRNQCLPDTLFGLKSFAIAKCRQIDVEDADRIQEKIERAKERIVHEKEEIKKLTEVKKKILKK
jgi:hypothetical protein